MRISRTSNNGPGAIKATETQIGNQEKHITNSRRINISEKINKLYIHNKISQCREKQRKEYQKRRNMRKKVRVLNNKQPNGMTQQPNQLLNQPKQQPIQPENQSKN